MDIPSELALRRQSAGPAETHLEHAWFVSQRHVFSASDSGIELPPTRTDLTIGANS
jgi:hypothetical protein